MRRLVAGLAPFLVIASLSFCQEGMSTIHHVSGAVPVNSLRNELSADRLASPERTVTGPNASRVGIPANTWQLLATLPGAIIHDISFPTAKVGYAAAELGQVWKTTDGGNTWTQVLNAGDTYYFYGVVALTTKEVVITGFYDSYTTYSVVRWSHDGGQTWTGDLSFGSAPLQRVRFANQEDGIIMEQGGGNVPTEVEFTTDGGATLSDWTSAVDNPSGGWFDPQFSLLTNLHARASGINFCTSLTGGSEWTCGNSVDPVFDGPVFFMNDKQGWVGGGEISPNVEGWLHYTTNGGKTWSGRTLDGPWPIRSILFLNSKTGWAGGGNVYTDVGGIYFSADGGKTWSVDVTTNSEMGSCAKHGIPGGRHQLWCAGFNYNGGFSSVIYSTQY